MEDSLHSIFPEIWVCFWLSSETYNPPFWLYLRSLFTSVAPPWLLIITPPKLKDILLLVKDGLALVEICTPEKELETMSLESSVPIALSENIIPASPFDRMVFCFIVGLLNSCMAIPERLLSNIWLLSMLPVALECMNIPVWSPP